MTPPRAGNPPADPHASSIPLDTARWRLAWLWFAFGGVIVLYLVAQTFGGAYRAEVDRAWGWALPNFLPTLALMLSTFSADATDIGAETRRVRRGFFRLTVALSVFYLSLLAATLVGQAFFMDADLAATDIVAARLEFLERANLYLGPLQAAAAGALGVLFFGKSEGAP